MSSKDEMEAVMWHEQWCAALSDLSDALTRVDALRTGMRQIAVGEYDQTDLAAAYRQTAEIYLQKDDEATYEKLRETVKNKSDAASDEWKIVGYCDANDGCDVPHPIRRRIVAEESADITSDV